MKKKGSLENTQVWDRQQVVKKIMDKKIIYTTFKDNADWKRGVRVILDNLKVICT
jgi:hypothetical protein